MPNQGVVIKVGLAGAATAKREAKGVGTAVKEMGGDAEKSGRKFRIAEVSMRGFEKTTHKLHHTVRDILGATGLAGLAFETGEIVRSAIDAQTAQAKLQATMKTAGLSWRRYGKDVDESLEKQSLATGFSRAQVTDAFSNFIRTTGSVRKATKLNNLAFDVARTKGLGLAQVQSLLARVYNGSYVGLKRLGIAITPITVQQDKLKASGRKYTTQQLARAKADDKAATATQALKIVQQKFSGQAKAYTKTAQGSVEVLKASLEAIQEKIGTIILPGIARGTQKLAALAQKLVENWPKISAAVKQYAGKIKNDLSPLLSFIDKHQKGLEKTAAAFAGIALALKAIKKVGSVTGISKAASVVATSPVGRAIGVATKADGSIKRPFYVIVLDKAGGGAGSKILRTAKKLAPAGGAAGGFSAAEAAALAGSAALPIAGIVALALTNNKNLPTRGHGASSPSNPAGHVGFDQGALNRRSLVRPVNPAAVSGPTASSPAGQAILGNQQNPFELHTHVNIDGREVAHAVTRAVNKKQSLK